MHDGRLILIPTQQSKRRAQHVRYPAEATIIGRVTGSPWTWLSRRKTKAGPDRQRETLQRQEFFPLFDNGSFKTSNAVTTHKHTVPFRHLSWFSLIAWCFGLQFSAPTHALARGGHSGGS